MNRVSKLVVLSVLSLALACPAPGAAEPVSATPAVPEWEMAGSWWPQRFEAKRAEAREGKAKIVFLGDSVTHLWEREDRGKAVWDANFGPEGRYPAVNAGISSDRTEHLLWRIEHGQLDGLDPRAIVLMIGTNNTGRPREEESPADTIYAIRKIVRELLVMRPGAKIILHPIFPRGASTNDPCRLRNEAVNAELCRIADGRRVLWCDFNAKLLGPDGALTREMAPDLLHPSRKGYEIWAAELKPYLDYALGYSPEVPAGAKPAPRPAGRPDLPRMSNWIDYRIGPKRAEIQSNSAKTCDLVFLGDSITHFWEERAPIVQRVLLPQYTILNLGFSGDRVENLLWGVLHGGFLDGYMTRGVMILVGTNNSGDCRPEETAAGIRALVAAVRAKQPGAKVMLLAIFPRGAKPDDPCRVVNNRVNELIRPLADGKNVIWCDLGPRFLSKDGTLTPEMMPDLLHPSEEGYRLWAEAMLPVFRQVCGK